jgi:hypothetical protein
MLASAIATRVKKSFGDSAGVLIDDTMIFDWINEAQHEIVRETHCLRSTATIASASSFSTGQAVNSGNYMLIIDVYYGNKPLSLTDRDTINRLGLAELETQEPRSYYMDGPLLYVFPIPTSTDTTDVVVHFVPVPTVVTAAGDTPQVPVVWHPDLADYCIMKAHERNENFRAAEYYEKRFLNKMSQRKFEGFANDDTYRTIGMDPMDVDYGIID